MCEENNNNESGNQEEVPDIIEAPDLVYVQESADIPEVKSEKEE